MGNELVNLEVSPEIVVHKTRELRAALDATERAALPYATSDELEGPGGDLLAGSGDTDDDGFSPALVAGLECGAHNVDVARAVECVVAAAVGHLDELFLDALLAEFGRVDKVGCAELLGPGIFCVVDVDDDDLAGLVLGCSLDDGQADAASAEDGNIGAFLDTSPTSGDDGGTVTGCDTAAEQAGAVHWGLFCDGDDGDVRYDGVLRECGCAHEVEEILALALKARSAIRHDTLALGCSDLAAEVGLSGLAELALSAFWGAVIVR